MLNKKSKSQARHYQRDGRSSRQRCSFDWLLVCQYGTVLVPWRLVEIDDGADRSQSGSGLCVCQWVSTICWLVQIRMGMHGLLAFAGSIDGTMPMLQRLSPLSRCGPCGVTRGVNDMDIFDHIWDWIYLEEFISESGCWAFDTISVFEYSNRIFMMLICNRIISAIANTIHIRIRT